MAPGDPWAEIFRRFDPQEPASKAHRAPRKRSPAVEIAQRLEERLDEPKVLVPVTSGTGTTTELLRLAEMRAGKELVVHLDLHAHFASVVGQSSALQTISPWEIIFLVGLAVLRVSDELLPYPVDQRERAALCKAWERLADETAVERQPELDVTALAQAMILTVSKVAGAVAPPGVAPALEILGAATQAVKWALPIGLSKKSVPDQAEEIRSMLAATNAIIGHVQSKACRLLVILDGTDRISNTDTALDLVVRSDLVSRLVCPVVMSSPVALRFDVRLNASPFDVQPLLNEPVMDHQCPGHLEHPGEGIEFLCDVFARRTEDLPKGMVEPEHLRKLAFYSGGRVRDFIRLVRALARFSRRAGLERANAEVVQQALDDVRRLIELGLDQRHLEILRSVAESPRHGLPELDEHTRNLLSAGQLLPYPNASEWFYPHPLLTLHQIPVLPC